MTANEIVSREDTTNKLLSPKGGLLPTHQPTR